MISDKVVVLLNGPIKCGKDTVAERMVQCGFVHLTFKAALIEHVCNEYNLSAEWWALHYTRERKEVVCPELCGRSPRGALIHMAEQVIKPTRGDDYFAQIVCRSIEQSAATLFVVSDLGFAAELNAVRERFPQTCLVHIGRAGCDWSADSRTWQRLPDSDSHFIDNNDTLDALFVAVDRLVAQICT